MVTTNQYLACVEETLGLDIHKFGSGRLMLGLDGQKLTTFWTLEELMAFIDENEGLNQELIECRQCGEPTPEQEIREDERCLNCHFKRNFDSQLDS